MVALLVEFTEDIVALNPTLDELNGTVTVAGRATAALLLDMATFSPPFGAGALKVTVQASVPEEVTTGWLQETALRAVM